MSKETNRRASQLNLDHLEQAGQLAISIDDHLGIAIAAARIAESNKVTTHVHEASQGEHRQLETVEAVPTQMGGTAVDGSKVPAA